MAMQNNNKKRVVWQDIKPAKAKPKVVEVSPPVRIKKPRKQIHFTKISKKLLFVIIAVVIASSMGVVYYFFFMDRSDEISEVKGTSTANSDEQSNNKIITPGKGSPEFSTVLPTGKSISDFGGWTLINPGGADPAYTYTDKIDGVSINISEQKLPEDFIDNTEENIENLAVGFNANEKISANGIIVHIGSSTDGPQSVIFSKNNLLILIKSDTSINNDRWAEYILALE